MVVPPRNHTPLHHDQTEGPFSRERKDGEVYTSNGKRGQESRRNNARGEEASPIGIRRRNSFDDDSSRRTGGGRPSTKNQGSDGILPRGTPARRRQANDRETSASIRIEKQTNRYYCAPNGYNCTRIGPNGYYCAPKRVLSHSKRALLRGNWKDFASNRIKYAR